MTCRGRVEPVVPSPTPNESSRPVSVTRKCPLHACLLSVRQIHLSQPCAVTWIPCVPRERGIALDRCYRYVYIFLSPCTLKPLPGALSKISPVLLAKNSPP